MDAVPLEEAGEPDSDGIFLTRGELTYAPRGVGPATQLLFKLPSCSSERYTVTPRLDGEGGAVDVAETMRRGTRLSGR